MGELVANDRASYQYLVESIRKFPKQEDFAQMLRDAGLRAVTYTNLTAGCVAIHSGFRLPG
jgi:ubiquinone/menaquinone biosynthesis C-methylase UbiE